MSKFLENKQLVHIASEVVILLGLTFYFNQQNKKLKGYIEDLVQRVEEQEDLLQKHEQIIRKLVEHINQMPVVPPQAAPVPQQQQTPPHRPPAHRNRAPVKQEPRRRKTKRSPSNQVHTEAPLSPPAQVPAPAARVSFMEATQIEERPSDETEIVEESESDLDVELAEELGELLSDPEFSDEEEEAGLKKEE